MNLVIIIGPSAVGKRTVGLELSKLTNYILVHNHQPKDFVIDVNGEFDVELLREVRKAVVRYYAEKDVDGLILSFRYNYMSSGSMFHMRDLIESVIDCNTDSKIYIVELTSPIETRIERNKTSDRENLHYMKDEQKLIDSENQGVYYSADSESHFDIIKSVLDIKNMNMFSIDNTNLSASEVANIIHNKIVNA